VGQVLTISDAQRLFDPMPGWLNSATYGLPPRPAWDALQTALGDWRVGRGSWLEWSESAEVARARFARLVGAGVADVAIGSAVSQFVGLVAASLPPGARVLAPEIEFGSNLFPYQMHESRGVVVETVPPEKLLDRIDESVDVVAVSAVQSSTGEVSDLAAVGARAREAGALFAVDATQAVGWLPIDVAGIDVLVCAAYKWLCALRGTAFCYVSPDVLDRLPPLAAGWYAGEDVHSSYYGPRLELASDARRFDLSPAWHCWVTAAPTLEIFEQVGVEAINEYDVGLANRFRAGLGQPPSDSAIVSASVPDAARKLEAAGIRAATRAGSLRVSFHLYTTEADVDAALDALVG
jgi:selenocysteine lyase/cysteine desulfurase